jgi:hypothetical protein
MGKPVRPSIFNPQSRHSLPSSGEITKGLRKSVPAKYVAHCEGVDRPEARMTSKRTMAVETNNMMCAMKTREQEL